MEKLTVRKGDGKGTCGMPCFTCDAHCGFIDDVFDKLADYEDAEEQGLLLRLPCPIGATIYVIEENGCEGDSYNCHHNCEDCQCYSGKSIQEAEFEIDWIDAVGQFVFLTREEAEKALADMGV